ncbi:MAG TPA: 3-oxoacyl-ACP reductase FabG [Thermoleophilaceae bacterium]|nr:3-oxoacyl-ACP reductase FabG [Thermoleophilaceae bacterium]
MSTTFDRSSNAAAAGQAAAAANTLPLSGKAIVVTGGSRGIGAGVVRMALAQGADVAFSYNRNLDGARALCEEMQAAHPERQCLALHAQVADTGGSEEFADAALEWLGTIDVLVNNAGVTRDMNFARMQREDWDEVIETNLGSMFNVTKPFVMPLVKRRGGAIINITSVVGVYGAAGQTSYAASKAGIIGFTKSLAKEIGGMGVRVNAVAPGIIETDMTAEMPEAKLNAVKAMIPQGLGTVEDVAHVVCFLASDRARYINGQVIEVGGGLIL